MLRCVWLLGLLGIAASQDRTIIEAGSGNCSSHLLWGCEDGKCISRARLCDQTPDCANGEDEKKIMCLKIDCDASKKYLCEDGLCIGREMVCDGNPDCHDAEDEEGCFEGPCKEENFDCGNSRCIPKSWVCDGRKDCHNGKDEQSCEPVRCRKDFYRCDTNHCMHIDTNCDGIQDCDDGRDEENCEWVHCDRSYGKYLCGHECISADLVCDGKEDCIDGTDEGELCSKNCSEYDCSHNCFRTPAGPRCYCKVGYLMSNNEDCIDIDECSSEHEVCDHSCINTQGSYKCSCSDGYELRGNSTCRISDQRMDPARLFFIVDNKVLYQEIDGSNSDIIMRFLHVVHSIAYDPVEDMLYWNNGFTKVGRTKVPTPKEPWSTFFSKPNRDGTIVTNLKMVSDIEMDWLGRNLYVVDFKASLILACNVDNGDCTVVLKSIDKPKSIELDLEMRYLFIGGSSSAGIIRTGLDGTGKMVLLQKDEDLVKALTVYPPAKRIFYYRHSSSEVVSMDYDGKDVKIMKNVVGSNPTSMAIWEGNLYWSEELRDDKDELMRFQKIHGTEIQVLYKTSLHKIEGLLIHHEAMYKKTDNPCESNLCSHICLLSRQEAEFTCACPETMRLAPNGLICIESPRPSLLTTHTENGETTLKKISDRFFGPQKVSTLFDSSKFGKISDTFFDHISDTLYLAELDTGSVYSVKYPVVKVEKVLKDLEKPTGIAVDSLRKNIYWISSRRKTIHISRMGGTFTKQILQTTFPADIAIDVYNASLFISTKIVSAGIWRTDLSGGNGRKIVDTSILEPNSLAIDPIVSNQYIYWTDYIDKKLERCTYDGKHREVVLTAIPDPMAVALSSKNIYILTRDNILGTINRKDFRDVTELKTGINSIHVSHTDEFCSLSVMESIDTKRPRVCIDNDGCDQFCFSEDTAIQKCDCEDDKVLTGLFACKTKPCPDTEVACNDGQCIEKHFWCDGRTECEDGSDEQNCTKACGEDEFTCDNGECIPMSLECLDEFPECKDGSDVKKKCPKDCLKDQWRCRSQDCIRKDLVCNKVEDCPDGSDEENCEEVVCTEDQISCLGSRVCVDRKLVCDGSEDCPQGDDEKHCSCRLGQFACDDKDTCIEEFEVCDGEPHCPDGSDEMPKHQCRLPPPKVHDKCGPSKKSCDMIGKECIKNSKWCDGHVDCKNATDELDCQKCTNNMVQCRTVPGCVQMNWVCDDTLDCSDGSDEENCHTRNIDLPASPCSKDEFACDDVTCIPWSKTCNGKRDCQNGADEGDMCDPCKDNGGCHHLCSSGPNGAHCSCKRGFKLNKDGKTCDRLEDCRDVRFYCDQICVETGSCDCNVGYTLNDDKNTCAVVDKNSKPQSIIVWKGEYLKYYSLDYHLVQKILLPPKLQNIQLEHDGAKDHVYVMDKKSKQFRIYKNGHWHLLKAKVNPIAFTVDSYNENLYVAEKLDLPNNEVLNYSSIKACSLVNSRCVSIVSSIAGVVESMVVSSDSGYLAYCLNNDGVGEIVRVGLEGDNRKKWIYRKSTNCHSLSIHPSTKSLFWIDSNRKIIQVIDKLGGDRDSIKTQDLVQSPSLVVVGNNIVYQNRPPFGNITHCSLRTQDCQERDFRAILVGSYNPSYEKERLNECHRLKCDHVCIETMRVGHCKCSSGYKTNGNKCTEDPSSQAVTEECVQSICDHGRCVVTGHKIECRCDQGYTGPTCEMKDTFRFKVVWLMLGLGTVGGTLFALAFWASKKYSLTNKLSGQRYGVHYSRDTCLITHEGGSDAELNSTP